MRGVALVLLLATACAKLNVRTDVYNGVLPTPETSDSRFVTVIQTVEESRKRDQKVGKELDRVFREALEAVEASPDQAVAHSGEGLRAQTKKFQDEVDRSRTPPSPPRGLPSGSPSRSAPAPR